MANIGLIPIRTGSKRFPGKNFSSFLDTTLLKNTVDKLIKAKVDKIYISTDNFELVKDFAVMNNMRELVNIHLRVNNCSDDEATTDSVVSDFIIDRTDIKEEDVIIVCQTTSPNWSAHRLIYALHKHEEKKKVIISVSPNYQPNGCFYIFSVKQFNINKSILINDLYLVVLTWNESIDIDYKYQLKISEAIAINSKDEN